MSQKKIEKTNLATYNEDSKRGLIKEVDLEYPKELHNLRNDYPLAVEKTTINKDVLSKYCKYIREKYGITIGQVQKLIPTLYNKEK